MSLTIGIVGLPNVGKSTLFNALTKNDVLAANYPFATIEPNVGVVGVPDPRLTKLAEIFSSQRVLPATVDFVDIGIVRGASEGEGLGNKFLANIRESDAICQVIRAFKDENVVHVDGKVSPKDDIETINTELILADLQTVEKVLPRLQKESRIKKDTAPKVKAVEEAKEILEKGDTLFAHGIVQGTERNELLHDLHLLTTKPFLYVFNVDEDELTDEDFKNEQRALVAPAEAIFLNAKLEADLAELDEDEALELLQSVGQDEPGLATLAHVGFRTLGLQTYLTVSPKESAPGRSRRAPPPPRPPVSSTPTSRRASSRPRSSPSTTWSRPAPSPRPAPRARPAWRARTTSCRTATWSSSGSTCSHRSAEARIRSGGPCRQPPWAWFRTRRSRRPGRRSVRCPRRVPRWRGRRSRPSPR